MKRAQVCVCEVHKQEQGRILGVTRCKDMNRYEGHEEVHTGTKVKNRCRQAPKVGTLCTNGQNVVFQQELGLNHVHYWKSVNIRGIPKSIRKKSNIAWLSLIQNIIVQYIVSNLLVICVCFKIHFLIDSHCKALQKRQKLLKFLQGI